MIFGPATTALHEIKDSDYVRLLGAGARAPSFPGRSLCAIPTFMAITAGADRSGAAHGAARRADLLHRADRFALTGS